MGSPPATSITRHELALAAPFEISRGDATETVDVHVVALSDPDGPTGYGGASPAAYYGETPATVDRDLPDLLEVIADVGDVQPLQALERGLAARAPERPAARAAVSIAAHDLVARRAGEPLVRRWGLDPDAAPPTSFTVGLAAPEEMAERARAAVDAGFDHLKVKLGSPDDRARFDAVREAAPDATLRVDANGDWTAAEAIGKAEWLADGDVELLEQPVPGDDVAGLREVREAGAVPVAADESCVTAADVPAVADAADVVVVKLMKCGGVGPAWRQIAAARACDLEVMLGCMVESNASIAAACHLAPLVDYADLDGSLLLAADPYEGVPTSGGALRLAGLDRPGTGVRPG
jgi:L-alanine-DL-glutamate epimerase-like enolase superfamily enzyme